MTACSSAKVKISPQANFENIRSLAVLPTDYPSGIQREKVDAIVYSIKSELKNSNFELLADKIVNEVCSTPSCPERKILSDKYLVDGFVNISVASVSRNNFIAGFYNAIKGKLLISDSDSKPVFEVEHTQSEKGGLIFNSGQVIQAIISYKNNNEADSFASLSSGFAQSLVSKIPKRLQADINKDAIAVNINNIEVKQIKPEIFHICADVTQGSVVSVIVNKQSTNLRPVSDTNYCGIFLYSQPNQTTNQKIEIDARSPFGNSVRKEVQIDNEIQVCNLKDNVVLTEMNGKPVINIKSCPGNKLLIFKASSDLGPFEKVAEINSGSWVDSKAKKGSMFYYELVSVNKSGVWSLPEAAKPESTNS